MSERPYDQILEYLSALQVGSWNQLKQAVDIVGARAEPDMALNLLAVITAQNCFSLAHVEIAFDGDLAWRVCSASLVRLPGTSCEAVLAGARTALLVDQLTSSSARAGTTMLVEDQRMAPSRIQLSASDDEALEEVAAEAGIPFLEGSPDRILSMLPSVASLARSADASPAPSGYEISKFDAHSGQWVSVSSAEGDGAYRYARYRPEYWLSRQGVSRRVERGVAVYAELSRARISVVGYDPETEILSVPGRLRMPMLYERSLVLRSGLVPRFDLESRQLAFSRVPRTVADLLISKLGQLGEDA